MNNREFQDEHMILSAFVMPSVVSNFAIFINYPALRY